MRRFILLAALLVACKEDKGPSCAVVVDHMLDVTKQAMPGHDPGALGDRKAMIAQCEKRNMPAKMRKCLMAATSLAGFGECQEKAKPAPTRPLPSTEPTGSAAAPTPTESGSPAAPAGSGS
ncbi:MAG: hypothetical protein HOV81_00830 [Kofleriaceae bacterium]|nr:hypothetical protein [Kofleriaceae bacterium]